MKIPTKYIVIFIVLVLGGIIWSSLSQPGVGDLEGDFTLIATERNENNTGPVNRIYAVMVSDTLWREMKQYGNYMPYSKLGTTTVWFFDANQPAPGKLTPGKIQFSSEFNNACLGKYEKNNTGAVSLYKFPFR
jgi:hypothetical protein